MKNAYKIFIRKPERKRSLRRPRRRWEDNIKMKVEIFWEGLGRIQVTENSVQWSALLNTVMDCRIA